MALNEASLFLLLVISVVFLASGHAADLNGLSADAIMEQAVARVESQYQSYKEVEFESESITRNQKFDGKGAITETEILRARQYPLHGAVFEELLEVNGRPLDSKEREAEEKKKRNFIQEVEKRRDRGDYLQPEKDRAIRFDADFVSRYVYELVAAESIRAHMCWKIAFKPKEGALPVRRTMDHALNQLTGTLWVSQQDDGLARVEFAMRKPFKYWGGVVAMIRNTDGIVDYERVEPGVWLPLNFELKLDIRIMLFKHIRQIISKQWYDYRRVHPTAAGAAWPPRSMVASALGR